MNLLIDSSQRFIRKISIFNSKGQAEVVIEGEGDIVNLIDQALSKAGIGLRDLQDIRAVMEGPSRVGINIGVAAANALNYALGFKKINQLVFPADSEDTLK